MKNVSLSSLRTVIFSRNGARYIRSWLLVILAVLSILFATTILVGRYWVMPRIAQYRLTIAASVSGFIGLPVTIGTIQGTWQGLNPRIEIEDLTIFDAQIRPAVRIRKSVLVLSWHTLWLRKPEFALLELEDSIVKVDRDYGGLIRIAGLALNAPGGSAQLSDWLLAQPAIALRNATVQWNDTTRAQEPLNIRNMDLEWQNHGRRHSLSVQAQAPQISTAPITLKAVLRGRTLNKPEDWRGQLYVDWPQWQAESLHPWFDAAKYVQEGHGSWRGWVEFQALRVRGITMDLDLHRLSTQLPTGNPLQLSALSGRVHWEVKENARNKTMRIQINKLTATTAIGTSTEPTDFLLELVEAKLPQNSTNDSSSASIANNPPTPQPSPSRIAIADWQHLMQRRLPEQGKLVANYLNLESWLDLFASFNLPGESLQELRTTFLQLAPKGILKNIQVTWKKKPHDPLDFRIQTEFANLGIKRIGDLPELENVSGTLTVQNDAGNLILNSKHAEVKLPHIFLTPLLFDTLSARVSWKLKSETATEIRLQKIAFQNADTQGEVSGTITLLKDQKPRLDLTASLPQVRALSVAQYIPLMVGSYVRAWLSRSVISGDLKEVRVRVRGDAGQFPFAHTPNDADSIFTVTAHTQNTSLRYLPDWPAIENLVADLRFDKERLEMTGKQAWASGTELKNIHASIPDLISADPIVQIGGQAEGQSRNFLAFIMNSPLFGKASDYIQNLEASGTGSLVLGLVIPLHKKDDITVRGSYTFDNNRLTLRRNLPSLEKLNGRVDFHEGAVEIHHASAIFLGMPLAITAASRTSSEVSLMAAGVLQSETLAKHLLPYKNAYWNNLAALLQGSTPWKAQFNLHKKSTDFVLESTLLGMGIQLPAPFTKPANQKSVFRVEQRWLEDGRQHLALQYGTNVQANILCLANGNIDRGVIVLGFPPKEIADRNGLSLYSHLAAFHVEEWLRWYARYANDAKLLAESPELGGATNADSAWRPQRIDFIADKLHWQGKEIDHFAVQAQPLEKGQWNIKVSAPLANGELTWNPKDNGSINARFKNLTIKNPEGLKQSVKLTRSPATPLASPSLFNRSEMPALDVVINNFVLEEKQLGRLELIAKPQNDNWRIDKLRIQNPAGRLSATGLWDSWLGEPQTHLDFSIEIDNIGDYLQRLEMTPGIQNGTATLSGKLRWNGSPYELDVKSLSGQLKVQASNGKFQKLEPGIGKLLGVLSLQALPRRLGLDFQDIFNSGLAFDSISGEASIAQGIANTQSLHINSPAAKIDLTGTANLIEEKQNLHVLVLPTISDSFSVAGALVGGPVVGIATYIAQKILRDPLNHIASFQYEVTGTWTDPVVTRVNNTPRKNIEPNTP